MKSLDVHSEIETLRSAGTGQLRRIAKLLRVKGASKLKRDKLIFAIIGKQLEAAKQLTFKTREASNRK